MAIKPSTTLSPNPLSFPAHIFAKLSPGPFLHANLSTPQSTRPSGRSPSQSRPPTCTTSSLSHTSGSAVVRIGDTAVVCGVRGEILKVSDIADYQPRDVGFKKGDEGLLNDDERRRKRKADTDEMAKLNLLVPNLELATGCSPGNLPGGPPSMQAQTLSQRILTLLHTAHLLDIDDLRIWHQSPVAPSSPSSSSSSSSPDKMDTSTTEDNQHERSHSQPELKAFWTLYIDILFISLDGNPFDTAWFVILAALIDVRLPRAWWDADHDTVLCDPSVALSRRLRISCLPVPLSYGVFTPRDTGKKGEKWVLVDMDGFEEGVCEEIGTVVVRNRVSETEVLRLEKSGGGGAGMGEMKEIVRLATERCREWGDILNSIR